MKMEKEIWKNVEGYPGYYVSTHGRVKSTKHGKERILKPGIQDKCGYMYVSLCFNGKIKHYYIHRLVAKAFISNPTGLPCVNHRDEITTNNLVENLEWCDYRYNINYGTANKRRSDALLNNKNKSKAVMQLTLDGKPIATYPSLSEASRFSGLSVTTIWSSANGITKKPKQFKWEFVG